MPTTNFLLKLSQIFNLDSDRPGKPCYLELQTNLENITMTAFLTKTNATSTFYHSEIGYVNFIKRHSAKLALVVDGVPKSIDLGTGKFASDVMFFKSKKVDFYVIELGCGSLLKFPWSAVEYLEQGRHCVELCKTQLLEALPKEVELKAFEF